MKINPKFEKNMLLTQNHQGDFHELFGLNPMGVFSRIVFE